MNNGCVCCSVRQDLIETFHQMFKNELFATLDWVVIETTGNLLTHSLTHSLTHLLTYSLTHLLTYLPVIRSGESRPIDTNFIYGFKMSRIFTS